MQKVSRQTMSRSRRHRCPRLRDDPSGLRERAMEEPARELEANPKSKDQAKEAA